MLGPDEISIVHWFPDLERHKCGYCKSKMGSLSYGMWAESLNVEDYQNLIDRGWRRSGKYCYKPLVNLTCCPQYTIRCDVTNFKPSKSQKKIVKKVNKYQEDGNLPKSNFPYEIDSETSHIIIKDRPEGLKIGSMPKNVINNDTVESIMDEPLPRSSEPMDKPGISTRDSSVEKSVKAGLGADPSKPPCKKAKLLRLERKQQKMEKCGMTIDKQPRNEIKSLSDLLGELPKSLKHRLRIRLVPSSEPNVEWECTKQIEFELYKKYQIVIHNDTPDHCTVKGFTRFLVSSPLQLKIVHMDRVHIHFDVSAQLYAKYQMFVHNDSKDDCSEDQFYDFLVNSPIEPVQKGAVKYGSFHQQYWLDEKLIAVGVIDILPKCISSVYFFYDPDYRGLTLGTYGALREIDYAASLHRLNPSILYYYMGFYIHSCPKMRYKGKFLPSDLLCPETFEWVLIEKCLTKLDASKYSRLNENPSAVDANAASDEDLKAITIYLDGQICKFRHYRYRQRYADVFQNIAALVGKKCARTLLVVSPHRN